MNPPVTTPIPEWQWWLERIASAGPIVTALITAAGFVLAVMTYRKGHPEAVGKRKIELAEDILADFYKAREVIRSARFNVVFVGEESERKPEAAETPGQKKARDGFYRVFERLQKERQLFAELHARRYRAMAYFGKEAEALFDDFRRLQVELTTSASMLIQYWNEDPAQRPAGWAEWEKITGELYDPFGGDEFSGKVDALIVRAEGFFGTWLMRKTEKPKVAVSDP